MATTEIEAVRGGPRARPGEDDGVGRAIDGSWAATRWLAVRWLRRRWLAVLPVAVIVAVGSAGTLLSLAASQRTADAYGDYQDRAGISDVVINPSWATREIDSVIRDLPGVDGVTVSALLTLSLDDGQPRPRRAVDDPESLPILAAAVGSPDGGYMAMDRPVVVKGRLPTGTDEMVMTAPLAEVAGLRLGETTPMAFWEGVLLESAVEGDYEAYLSEEVESLGVEDVELVGIVTMPDEVLPDELYARGVAIVSSNLAARYACPLLDVEVASVSYDEMLAALLETPCASNYLFYSLSMEDGPAGVKPALDEYVRRAAELSPQTSAPAGADIQIPAYELFSTEAAQLSDRVARAIRPTVAALAVLGAALAVVAIVLACLVAARELRRTRAEQRQWHQLGIDAHQRALVTVLPLLAAVLVGGLVGVAAGWFLDQGPVGVVRVVEPDPARRLSDTGLAAVVGLVLVTASAMVVLAAWSARRVGRTSGSHEIARVASWRGRIGSPAVADGVAAAYGSRAAIPVVAGLAVLTGTFVATGVFAASLSTLVSTPRAYGWPWDVAAVHNLGYGGMDVSGLAAELEGDAAVERWGAYAIQPGFSLEGEPVTAIVGYDDTSEVDLPLLSGTLPRGPGEIAIGRTTARDLGVEVGDTVELVGIESDPQTVTITGETVFPTLGPYQAERVSTGSGILLAESSLPEEQRPFAASFVGVQLAPGADEAAKERVRDVIAARNGSTYVTAFTSAVRPSEIVDARSMLIIPIAVCVVFIAAVGAGLLLASWAATRARVRELAILRALGFSGALVRTSVRVQSVATMAAAVALAVPGGVIVGRALWRTFATQLGVVPDPDPAWLPIAGVVLVGLLLAALAAELPARLATRVRPAVGLRAE